MSLLNWVKQNKLTAFLILTILLLVGKNSLNRFFGNVFNRTSSHSKNIVFESSDTMALGAPTNYKFSRTTFPSRTNTPRTDVSERLVVQESQLSLVVNDVRQSVNQIIGQAKQAGGYMVSSNLSQPEEAPFATVVVRIPSVKLDQTLENYRALAVKVSSENLQGRDVTDEYLDIDTRLARLKKTQSKFEEILDQATNFDQMLRAQREIFNLQDQIDNLLGRQQYLKQTAQLAKLTIYLSSDELALPYAPSETFRPLVTFKLAIRSLVRSVRALISLAIWLGVYSVVWIPALILLIFIPRWWKKHKQNSSRQ